MKIAQFKPQFFVLFLATLFVSCVYEPVDGTVEPDPGSGGNTSGIFKADFNNNTWTAAETQVVISGNFIEISAIKSNGEGFAFQIEANETGTYAANVNIVAYSPAGSEYGYWSLNDDNPDENTGSITITKIDTEKKTISGTFQFKGYWSDPDTPRAAIEFKNGVFTDLPYITEEETNDSFSAKVGGTNFVSTDILAFEINSGADDWITIGASDTNMNEISISVRTGLAAGTTYPITVNRLTDDVQASYEDENGEHEAVSGSVKIISITEDRIQGTFSFTTNGTPSINVTEGSFDVAY
ncbi:hypothetical protein B6A10_08860 [Flavobacterium sp. L1I52]|uniref:Uncharacterized protein n=1 Tax=Flavobacterium pokkalii TaxID=1940408 RepID=A0ABR7USC7_9FLAO|nr:DUF6252 family protein [Flavobacterium pokkalii]MBD0725287.1 hypothetical protein [Flavobacterium pokkalii]